MFIEESLDAIENIFSEYKKESLKLNSIETFFIDMSLNPSKFPGILNPIQDTNFSYLRYMVIHFYSFKIYIELENMYNKILADFDSSYKGNIFNINISAFINKIENNISKGSKINKSCLQSIANSDYFNSSSVSMAPILSIIEWRGKNAHHSIGSSNINLDEISQQFISQKKEILSIYLKLIKYLKELQVGTNSGNFNDY